jgi:hypothetical protein
VQPSDDPSGALFLAAIAAAAVSFIPARRFWRLGRVLRRLRSLVPQSLNSPPSGLVRLQGQVLRGHLDPGAAPDEGALAWAQGRREDPSGIERIGGDEPIQLREGGRGLRIFLDPSRVELCRARWKRGLHIGIDVLHMERETMVTWEIPEGDLVTLFGWCEARPDGAVALGGGPEGLPVLVIDGVGGDAERLLWRSWIAGLAKFAVCLALAGAAGALYLQNRNL